MPNIRSTQSHCLKNMRESKTFLRFVKFEIVFSCLTSRDSSLWRPKKSLACPVVVVVVSQKTLEKSKKGTENTKNGLSISGNDIPVPAPSCHRDTRCRRLTLRAGTLNKVKFALLHTHLPCYIRCGTRVTRLGCHMRGHMREIPDG